ncbi:actin binding protein [Sporothrix bragantina]|uniref:Actin binding protein n=1 Tax=Sporothrix bragantina TaxID=671064 RepID=A0ABP0BLI7_9PEZI
MTSLNLSINGPSIRSSYESVIKGTNHWALFSVQAPLANAFQDSGNKESVLKVDGTGSGELDELIEDFSEGRIQFAFVRVQDPNSGLPKNVLIAWCGGGVPERTKGYFTSHLAAVSKVLHGYHVQITARSQDDLEIDSIMKKVSDASGAKYTAGGAGGNDGPRSAPPPLAKKPVFTPTSSSSAHAPLVAARNRRQDNVDADGWGDDAPPVTRTQIEKVESAYKPVKVNMAELTKQRQPEPPRFGSSSAGAASSSNDRPDVIGGSYQPVGKIDIAAIRAAAKETRDDRPTIVKGAYEPVGKVDIAAIRAKAQPKNDDEDARPSPPPPAAPAADDFESPKTFADRSAAFSQSDRLTSLPKPKVANKFGGGPAFHGTKAPIPGPGGVGLGAPRPPIPPPVGAASRTFADQGGKTPAQIWAEKKAAKEGGGAVGGLSVGSTSITPQTSPLASQKSGGEWKSGYTGKSWGTVQTTNFGRGSGAVTENRTGESADAGTHDRDEPPSSPGGVSALRDRFKGAQPMGQPAPSAPAIPRMHTGENRGVEDDDDSAPPPPIPSSTRPPGAFQLPGLPSRPPPPTDEEEEEPEPEPQQKQPEEEEEEQHEREQSPIRIAAPVARAREPSPEPEPEPEPEPKDEPAPTPIAPRPVPAPVHDEPEPEPEPAHKPAHAVAGGGDGVRALIHYDYEKAEDNEIELVEGDYVTNIDQVDDDWWMGTNSRGETGLFPSNYVEIVGDDEPAAHHDEAPATAAHVPPPPPAEEPAHEEAGGKNLPWAYAQYDYEAGEDNELSFPEGAKVTDIEFPDDDWWFGHYQGQSGLFPSNYVELQQ